MDNKAVVAKAVWKAQKIAQEKGLISGKNVAHPNDPLTYELISVDDGMAIVGLKAKDSPTGQEIRKSFPLKELFNPYTAKQLLTSVMEDELNKGLLPGSGVMVIEL